jgi:SAM-dependent methyltransferase
MVKKQMQTKKPKLLLYPYHEYISIDENDPLKFYYFPIVKTLYRERLLRCLAQCRGGKSILEVGFGSGLTFPNLNQMYQKIVGIEKNDTGNIGKINQIFQRKGINLHLSSGDLLNLPYRAHSFDTVLVISVLEHLYPQNQYNAFTEIHRVLKPKGQLVYGVPIENSFMTFMFAVLGTRINLFHFSDQDMILSAARNIFNKVHSSNINLLGINRFSIYQVVHCEK